MRELEAARIIPPVDPALGWFATFSFPFKTEAHTNKRGNRFARAKSVKKEREALFFAWFGAGKPTPPRWPITVTFTRIAPRKLDVGDNLPSAFKGMRDELAKQLGLKGDGGDEVEWLYHQVSPQDVGLAKGSYAVKVEMRAEGRAA